MAKFYRISVTEAYCPEESHKVFLKRKDMVQHLKTLVGDLRDEEDFSFMTVENFECPITVESMRKVLEGMHYAEKYIHEVSCSTVEEIRQYVEGLS